MASCTSRVTLSNLLRSRPRRSGGKFDSKTDWASVATTLIKRNPNREKRETVMAVADYEKKVEQIKRALGKTQAQIDAVEQRRAASQQVINEHDAARSAHVVAARVNNDPQ